MVIILILKKRGRTRGERNGRRQQIAIWGGMIYKTIADKIFTKT